MYSGAPNVDSYASGKNVVNVRLPSVSALRSSEADADADDKKTQVSENSESGTAASFSISPEQIPELVTLSLLPKSQWQSLINLDIIKVCTLSLPSHTTLMFFCQFCFVMNNESQFMFGCLM